jgi:hypothetical protein
MASEDVRKEGLAALCVAAVELIEDRHDELASILPDDPQIERNRMRRLRRLGTDLKVLGEAGLVLLNELPQPDGKSPDRLNSILAA